jgi:hypothetical protein
MRKPGSENAPIPPHRSTKNRSPFAGICVSALIRKPQVIGCRVIDVIAPGPEPEWEEIESGFGASSPGTSKNVATGVSTKGMCHCQGAGSPRRELSALRGAATGQAIRAKDRAEWVAINA